MYCTECGALGTGKFCAECGTRLSGSSASKQVARKSSERGEVVAVEASAPDAPHWTAEWRYEHFVRHEFVRDQLVHAGHKCPNRISGEKLLALYDTVASPGVSLEKLSGALLPILDGIGLKKGSQAECQLLTEPGRALLSVLCALVAGGYEIEKADQLSKGCILTAFLPSTLITNRGKIFVQVGWQFTEAERQQLEAAAPDAEITLPLAVQIQATVQISGQIVDWGKGKRILAALLEELRRHPELRDRTVVHPGESPAGKQPAAPAISHMQQFGRPKMPEPKQLQPPPIRRDVA